MSFLNSIALQSPILEEEKRATHKLMRFGRNPSHQLLHFGKREADDDSLTDDLSNDIINQKNQREK
jgi:hypothetical protein